MADFECRVVRVEILSHPNADQIEIAKVGDFQSIVKKGQFENGALAVYIPEQALVPEWMLREMNLWDEFSGKGGLAGSEGRRVKAIKLRGVVSQGLVYPGAVVLDGEAPELSLHNPEDGGKNAFFLEGMDASEFLGIVKYEQPLPSHMRGRAIGADYGATHKYDFDNLKKTPNLFDVGELVVITEKIHGTLLQVCVVPEDMANEKYYKGRVVLTSKGLGGNGIILDHNDKTNLYAQAAKKHGLLDKMLNYYGDIATVCKNPIFLFGEVFGRTSSGACVQDLTYADVELDYRAFDICVGSRGTEKFAPWKAFVSDCEGMDIEHVPLLYIGTYKKDVVIEHTNGETTIGKPGKKQIREGCVVKSYNEDSHPRYGRKIAKSVSDAYLLRKGEVSEFN